MHTFLYYIKMCIVNSIMVAFDCSSFVNVYQKEFPVMRVRVTIGIHVKEFSLSIGLRTLSKK